VELSSASPNCTRISSHMAQCNNFKVGGSRSRCRRRCRRRRCRCRCRSTSAAATAATAAAVFFILLPRRLTSARLQVYHEWAPYYPLSQAYPVDYRMLPCTYFDPDGTQFTGFFSLALPGFRLDYAGGATWSPVGGTSFTSFDILCSTPSPPPSPPKWVSCACLPAACLPSSLLAHRRLP
jgi:hypothetical protein